MTVECLVLNGDISFPRLREHHQKGGRKTEELEDGHLYKTCTHKVRYESRRGLLGKKRELRGVRGQERVAKMDMFSIHCMYV